MAPADEHRLLDAGRGRRRRDPPDLRRKVINDAAAYARGLAETHGRNGDWAEEAVRSASNLGAQEALERTSSTWSRPTCPRC